MRRRSTDNLTKCDQGLPCIGLQGRPCSVYGGAMNTSDLKFRLAGDASFDAKNRAILHFLVGAYGDMVRVENTVTDNRYSIFAGRVDRVVTFTIYYAGFRAVLVREEDTEDAVFAVLPGEPCPDETLPDDFCYPLRDLEAMPGSLFTRDTYKAVLFLCALFDGWSER